MQTPTRQLDRLDRHVQRSYVRLGERVSRYRVEFALEEALRLVELPGEREGRIYFFRSVVLPTLDGEATRSVWIASVQQAMSIQAAQARHGGDRMAGEADAIYFENHEQALEALLTNALCRRHPAWFCAPILQIPPDRSHVEVTFAVVDRLRQTVPDFAFAALVLRALENLPVASILLLLESIPEADLHTWLRTMDPTGSFDVRSGLLPAPSAGLQSQSQAASLVPLKAAHLALLVFAAQNFGWQAPRTLWLAALAVRLTPTASVPGDPILRRTRAILRSLEAASASERTSTKANSAQDHPSNRLQFDDVLYINNNNLNTNIANEDVPRGDVAGESSGGESSGGESSGGESSVKEALTIQNQRPLPAPATESGSGEASPYPASRSGADPSAVRTSLLGEPTRGAGLFFLLNVIQRLGIVGAIAACPELVATDFVIHLVRELAQQAGVPLHDPVLLALETEVIEFDLPEEVTAGLPPTVWPANLRPETDKSCTAERLLRVWCLGVRRWCWQRGRLKLSEIVLRQGKVWATLTDIDVTLPLKQADVRIRLVALDIDPGWLPWMGRSGRVVRFHYREAESGLESEWDTPYRGEQE